MRYRIYGRDEASRSPVEPFVVDAEDEEDARSRASELGTVVDRLEVAGQEAGATEQSPPPPAAAPLPAEAVRPSPHRVPPRPRGEWLLVCFALVLASLAVGVGIGVLFPRVARTGPGSPTSSSPAPAGIHIEDVQSAEELFALAGQQAVVLKYSGGDVGFWVEIEAQGRKEKINYGSGPGLPGGVKLPAPNQTVEGYFLLVRGEADDDGVERWKVACRRDLVTAQASGVRVSSPVAEVSASRSQENRESTSAGFDQPVRVWKGKRPGGFLALTSTRNSIPIPLPADREVCLKEVREERRKGHTDHHRDLLAVGASTLGLQGSPLGGGPLLTASALTPGRTDEGIDVHTIKVMCRAASAEGQRAAGEPSAK